MKMNQLIEFVKSTGGEEFGAGELLTIVATVYVYDLDDTTNFSMRSMLPIDPIFLTRGTKIGNL